MEKVRLMAPAPVPPTFALFKVLGIVGLAGALLLGFSIRLRPEIADEIGELFTVGHCHPSMERNASTSLKTITSAQADFRANDRDGDGINQFWRGDITGLYVLRSKQDPQGPAIKLIELSVASADDRPVTDLSPYAVRSAKAGYWFRALLHEDETSPSPDRFAACAFPDSPSAGKWTFIVDEENTIYRKEVKKQRGIDRYPKDPLKDGWTRID